MYENYVKLLKEYVSFKSFSTDLSYKDEMLKTVDWLSVLLKDNGFKVELLQGPKTNPVVLAEYIHDKKAETILIYGHYDVQPAEFSDGWNSDPFTLTEKSGRLIARGVVDNKGQNLIHIVSIIDLIKKNKLAYNIKFMIEGNEETSNPDMRNLVKKYKNLLKADYIVISDGEIVGDYPTIEASLRGGFNMTVNLKTGKTNLHSGLSGGAVPSSAHELGRLIEKLFTKKNTVAVPGFYDGVDAITPDQKKSNRAISTDEEAAKLFGVKKIICEPGMDCYTQVGLRPTIQVTGVKTGYIGEGYANIVPANAEIRLNVRLVASQKPAQIYEAICKFIKQNVPGYVDVSITRTEMSNPIKVDISSPKVVEAKSVLEKVYGKRPIIKYVGGGIPVVSDFKETLGIDTMLLSLGNDDCNMHGINENFKVSLVKKGLAFSQEFFSKK